MLALTISQIGEALGYQYQEKHKIVLKCLKIDSRFVEQGDLFVAIPGEKVDGHHYIKQALQQGAAGIVISDNHCEAFKAIENYILVDDSTIFVQKLAQFLRQQVTIPVVAITGSSGKTTTKDLLATILKYHDRTLATKGNNNNELGLPLTIAQIDENTKYLILEMGMRGLGQIDFLCNIAQPNYGLITNIGTVHSELLGSQENIAQAKAELLAYIPSDGAVALNFNDYDLLEPWSVQCRGEVLWYSNLARQGDVWAENIYTNPMGVGYRLVWGVECQDIQLNLLGEHNVENSLAAIIIARKLRVPWETIIAALADTQLTSMRMETSVAKNGAMIINDAYNANPQSMSAAVNVLAQYKPKRIIAVLGDMYELGQYEQLGHTTVGQICAQVGINYLIAVGELGKIIGLAAIDSGMKAENVYLAKDNNQCIACLKQLLVPQDVVLVKGSRGMGMEEIVDEILR